MLEPTDILTFGSTECTQIHTHIHTYVHMYKTSSFAQTALSNDQFLLPGSSIQFTEYITKEHHFLSVISFNNRFLFVPY